MGLEPKPINAKNLKKQDASLEKDQSAQDFLKELGTADYPKGVFIKCEGAYPADVELLNGKMKMFPEATFPKGNITNTAMIDLKYFPYDKFRKHNENPLVAIQFPNLFVSPEGHPIPGAGRLVHIICKAYYNKVIHSKKDHAGLVKFELYLDEKPKNEWK